MSTCGGRASTANHGGNIQVITARTVGHCGLPGCVRAANTTPPHCANTPDILTALATWIAENRPALGDLGYEGEAGTITVAFKKPQGGELTDEQKTHNKAHNSKRAIGERGNSLLKMTFKALRNISVCPWHIGKIVTAALVLLHIDHDRTT